MHFNDEGEALVIFDEWYDRGGRTAYRAGQHVRHTPVGSYHVQEGWRVKFYSGEGVDSHPHPWQYCRDVPEAQFYPYLSHGGPVTIVVEKTELPSEQVAELGWRQTWSNGGIDLFEQVAPTNEVWDAAGHFPNDRLEWVVVPQFSQLTVYMDGGGAGNHLAFSAGKHYLGGFSHQVSSVKLTNDDYEQVSLTYDWNNRIPQGQGEVIGGANTAENDSPIQQSIGVDISIAEGVEANWHNNIGASAGLTVTISAGLKPIGIGADAEVAANVTASEEYGKGGSTSSVVTQAHNLEADVPANSMMEVSLVVRKEKARCPTVNTLKNKRTGATFTEDGWVDITNLTRGHTVFGKPTPIG